jgi:hypothetical protein
MSERLKFMGRRQELEVEKKALEIKIQGLIDNLRDALDPLMPVEDLKSDAIAEWSAVLSSARERYREVVAALKQLRDILGG